MSLAVQFVSADGTETSVQEREMFVISHLKFHPFNILISSLSVSFNTLERLSKSWWCCIVVNDPHGCFEVLIINRLLLLFF